MKEIMKQISFALIGMIVIITSCSKSKEGEVDISVSEDKKFIPIDTTYYADGSCYVHDKYVNGYSITVSTWSEVLTENISVNGFVQSGGDLKEKTCELKKKLKAKLDEINQIKDVENDLENLDCS